MQNSPSQVKNWTTASWRMTRGICAMPAKIAFTKDGDGGWPSGTAPLDYRHGPVGTLMWLSAAEPIY